MYDLLVADSYNDAFACGVAAFIQVIVSVSARTSVGVVASILLEFRDMFYKPVNENDVSNRCAIVLAAGDGMRLRSLVAKLRGDTAIGLLLPLAHLLERHPDATVAVFLFYYCFADHRDFHAFPERGSGVAP